MREMRRTNWRGVQSSETELTPICSAGLGLPDNDDDEEGASEERHRLAVVRLGVGVPRLREREDGADRLSEPREQRAGL